jgi:hypothetical protein
VIGFCESLNSTAAHFTMRTSAEYQALLASKGVRIDWPGLTDIGLQRADALEAVDLLRTAGIAVLGGDVWYRHGSRFELAYANWHTDRQIGENSSAYLRRALDSTERYIREFPQPANCELLFVLVTAHGSTAACGR